MIHFPLIEYICFVFIIIMFHVLGTSQNGNLGLVEVTVEKCILFVFLIQKNSQVSLGSLEV